MNTTVVTIGRFPFMFLDYFDEYRLPAIEAPLLPTWLSPFLVQTCSRCCFGQPTLGVEATTEHP